MKRRPNTLPCMTEQQALRSFYRHRLRYRVGFSACRVYCIKGRDPTGRSISPEVTK